jgi:glutathione S-transferase
MKLYFAPGLCSLAPHIVLREADIPFELEQVIYLEKKTKSGADYWGINPKGQVPVLELRNGDRLTECAVILQFIADQKPNSILSPACGTIERYRLQEWLSFISSELHKAFIPIFRPTTPGEYKKISKDIISKRFDWLNKHLADRPYLMGPAFTVADAYLFTVVRWCPRIDTDLSNWPNIEIYADRIAARLKVQEAMKAEGLI